MQYVVQETAENVFAEVQYGASILDGNTLHPWQITELWSAEDLEGIGVFLVDPAPAPNPKIVVKGYSFQRIDGKLTQVLDIEIPEANTLEMRATARQIRLAMNQLGLRDEIETYVASQSIDVRDSWQYTTEFAISHPFIIGAKEQLNKTDEDLFNLFSLAQTFT